MRWDQCLQCTSTKTKAVGPSWTGSIFLCLDCHHEWQTNIPYNDKPEGDR